MPQRTILLVEDDRSVRRYLEVILQRAGYSVTVAADGLEAMKALLASSFDAVVTDAIMPHLDGYQLCSFIRRQPNLSGLPVVLLSGIEQAHSSQTDQARADFYLPKPVRPEELIASLARLLKK
ncbi:MAG: two-component system, OmpR family, response regulator [Blastocatellia bacterium]|jgi:CheY-like chemotaxis protein|nr:two-component system, OmpR family, response regulator [Blastocatellia bacterium]